MITQTLVQQILLQICLICGSLPLVLEGYLKSLCLCWIFSETLDPDLTAAASAAASTLPNRSQAESELLRQLRQRKTLTEAQKKGDMNNLGYVSCMLMELMSERENNIFSTLGIY